MPPKAVIKSKRLESGQNNFIDTINQGPDALDPSLFAGPINRVMLGLKAHANTISHARLVALEETFPMTREAIGEDIFNALTREYAELDHVKMHDNNQLGQHFEAFIRPKCAPEFADLIAIEWAWLQSYNAADAEPLSLEQLSQFDEEALLSKNVTWHPSLRLVTLQAEIPEALAQLRGVIDNPHSVMILRPDVQVNLLPIDAATDQVVHEAKNIVPLGNLLVLSSEVGDETNPLQPLLTLIGAGALICMDTKLKD